MGLGRYLLIACSRPGGQAVNLQGIWNNSVRPPWSSNYTTNINTKMNYWPAETANLSELHGPQAGPCCLHTILHQAAKSTVCPGLG